MKDALMAILMRKEFVKHVMMHSANIVQVIKSAMNA
jgi:hypothetical protein